MHASNVSYYSKQNWLLLAMAFYMFFFSFLYSPKTMTNDTNFFSGFSSHFRPIF